jgi:hypothetical protein
LRGSISRLIDPPADAGAAMAVDRVRRVAVMIVRFMSEFLSGLQ